MRTKLIGTWVIIVALMLVPAAVWAQGGCVVRQVVNPPQPTSDGQPSSTVAVRVCTTTATGTPCSPLAANIYTDPTLTQALANPTTTDQNGMYYFCALPATYLVQETPITGTVYSYQTTVNSSSPSFVVSPTTTAIVEQIRATVVLATGGGTVVVPAGTAGAYTASSCSTWTATVQGGFDPAGYRVGVQIPSNVEIYLAAGAQINVTVAASDPYCTLFANSVRTSTGNSNVRITGPGKILWTENNAHTATTTAPIIKLSYCDSCVIDGIIVQGNPNAMINLMDSTNTQVKNGWFYLNTTDGTHGNQVVADNTFSNSSSLTPGNTIGPNNHFFEIGYNAAGWSISNLSHDNSTWVGNYCDILNYVTGGGGVLGSCLEIGESNFGNIPVNITIDGNHIWGGGGMIPDRFADGSITNNWIYVKSGGISISNGNGGSDGTGKIEIAYNHVYGLEGATAAVGITVNAQNILPGITSVNIHDNNVEDGGILTQAYNSTAGGNNCRVTNNLVRNTPFAWTGSNGAGLVAHGCSVVTGNTVENVGADTPNDPNEFAFRIAPGGSSSPWSTFKTALVANNIFLDHQANHAGTGCSVATQASTTCLTTGTSMWFYDSGGGLIETWTNRYLVTASRKIRIRHVYSPNYIQFDSPATAFIASGTAYNLYRTTGSGWQFVNVTIDSFSNNYGYIDVGSYAGSGNSVSESTVTVNSILSNRFNPYVCSGCANVYQGSHTVSGSCTLGTNCAAVAVTFTSNATYDCMARDSTTPANAVTITLTSGTAVAFTGTGTDVVHYTCTGY